jgi:hypothetical protein
MDIEQDVTQFEGKDWSEYWEWAKKNGYDPNRTWEMGSLLYHNKLAGCIDCRKIVKLSDILYEDVGRCKTCEENKTECDCRALVRQWDDAPWAYSEQDKHKELQSWKRDRPVKREATPKSGRDWCCHVCGDVVIR